MKLTYFKTATRIILLQLALLLVPGKSEAATVGFTLTPFVISNTYVKNIQMLITNLPNGGTVIVQKYLDLNSNGVVDAGDLLVQQFNLTDNQAGMVFGGVTNTDVPGDTDLTLGQITAILRVNNGDFVQELVGRYLFVVSSSNSAFAPATNSLVVTNTPATQQITGVVSNGVGTVPNAIILIFPKPRPGNHGPGSPIGGTVADNSGNYSIQVPTGTYKPLAFVSNYVSDAGAAVLVTVTNGATIVDNLTVSSASRTISGTLIDAVNTNIVLPGLLEPVSDNGILAVGFSDTNGLLTLGVTSGSNWNLGSSDSSLIVHGYVGYQSGTNVDTSTQDVTNQIFPFFKATAMFYGSVLDISSNPLVGVDVSDADDNQMFSQDGFTDNNGFYFVGVVGNGPGTNDNWHVQVSGDSFTNYVFSQPGFDQNGDTNVAIGQAIQVNFTGLLAPYTISGTLIDANSNIITNVGISASMTSNNIPFNQSVDTDTNGAFSLHVSPGSWNITVNCNGGSDGLQNVSNNYVCPGNFFVNITSNNVPTNIVVLICTIPAQIITTNLPNGQVGSFYNQFLAGATCSGTAIWSLLDPTNFPGTLSLSPNGQIQGTPNTVSNYTFTVILDDGNSNTTNQTLSLNIGPPNFNITVQASPTNAGSVSGGGSFVQGGTNSVNAAATNGYVFDNWTSNGVPVSVSNTYTFILNTNVTLVANFVPPQFTFNVSASPTNGGTFTPGGSNTLGSTTTVIATNNPGFVFVHWQSNGVTTVSTTSYTFLLNTNVNLTAVFQPTFVTTVTTSGGGTASASSTNLSGATVTVIATNSPGYVFTNWTSNSISVSTLTNYSFLLTTNLTLTANFTLTPGDIEVFDGTNALANNQTNAISFPAVQITQTGPIVSFTVSNLGGSPLTISNISVPTNYIVSTNAPATLTNFPAVVAGVTNASPTNGVFSVQLVTSNAGTYSGNIVITNDNTNFTFAITGTVSPSAAAISVLDGATVITNGQSNAVNFGNATLNQSGITKVFTVTNPGLQTLNISNVSVSAGYTLTTNAATNVPAGSNTAFSVQLNTTAAGTISGTVTISNNAPGENPFVFPITGFVASKIIAVAGNLAFGVVPINTVSNLTMVISNLGSTNLTVTNISFPAGFAVSWSNGIIVAGSNQLVTVTFSPTAATNYGGNITVGSDSNSGSGTLPVSGFGSTTNLFLTVITNGSGTVAPILTAKPLIAGHKYTLNATAKPGNVFSNWTGSFVTNKDPLTFTFEPGTVIEANFIPNPFLAVKGVYNGLFSATNGQITEATAGMLRSLTVGTRGTYSGTLMVNGSGHGLSGTFSLGGLATNKITRPATQGGNLTVVLNLATASNATPEVTGTITATNWISTNLVADLASNVSFSSEYTLIIPLDTNNPLSNSIPQGDGYAVVTNHVGAIKITGALADGTAFNQSVPASQAGDVPVYASLYGNKGLLIGWINLSPTNAGALSWVHPSAHTGLFTSNFVSTNPIVLSGWTNPPATTSLPTNVIVLAYTNGVIAQSNALVITGNSKNQISEVSGTLPLSGTLNPKTGQLTLTLGSDGGKHAATAVVLLDGTNGGGFFVTKTNSGAILLKP